LRSSPVFAPGTTASIPTPEAVPVSPNAARLAELRSTGFRSVHLVDLLLRMYDGDGNRRQLRRQDEFPAASRAAGYSNPGAVTANGYVEKTEDDVGRRVSDKGANYLRSLGFDAA